MNSGDLYDEFGNYIGPELDSDDDEEDVLPAGQEGEDGEEAMEQVGVLALTKLKNLNLRLRL